LQCESRRAAIVTNDEQPSLLDYLTKRYASLKLHLTRKLGNADLASDALHDTWVRLKEKDEQRLMESPAAYLMRVATNIAADMERKQRRTVSGADVDALLDEMVEPAPGPAEITEVRFDLDAVTRLLGNMPERRRVIVVMVYWEDVPQKEVAKRLGISLRTVEYELKRAHDKLDALFDADKK
jgi:RNA polymerase sigma factor (sigma-70 family)